MTTEKRSNARRSRKKKLDEDFKKDELGGKNI